MPGLVAVAAAGRAGDKRHLAELAKAISRLEPAECDDVMARVVAAGAGRKGDVGDIECLTAMIGGIPLDERSETMRQVMAVVAGREGDVDDVSHLILMYGRNTHDRDAVMAHVAAAANGHAGGVSDVVHLAGAIGDIVPSAEREDVMARVVAAGAGRQGDVDDIISLIRSVLQTLPAERETVLARATGNPANQNVSDITRAILEGPAGANRPDALQVHREAAISMAPIHDFLDENISGKPLLTLEESREHIAGWIERADPGLFDEDAKSQMNGLLKHEKFDSALGMGFNTLGDGVNGELLLRKAATYCDAHPENINHLLGQGLLDAARAYGDNSTLDHASCVAGIAERFLLAFRDLAKTSTLVPDVQKSVFEHSEYHKYQEMGEEDENAADRAAWLTKYASVADKEGLRKQIQADLAALKPVLQAEQGKLRGTDNAKLAFETDSVSGMFKIFDDPKDTMAMQQLDRIWDALQAAKTTAP